ncbi:LysR family transcriptional regulator [Niveispirillum sp. KHB5.9]|uniref:LysR family transcriptional regulator n=1 Tax=Niveispirillum sp. KHB5.9 TaxID=3400269 RepID=UPI003A8A7746
MDKLQAMQVFVQVVELNGFARAADKLGLPRASVTTIIQNLEAHLGTSLLQRTTRRLSLTADGEAFHERAIRILAEVEEVETGFIEGRRHPKGRLHVDMPTSIGRLVVIPALREFHARYPDIELKLGMNDRQIDIVQEGVDCVLRVGELADSSLIARRLGLLSRVTCASPAYLQKHGVPKGLDDLASHKGVRYFSPNLGNRSYPFEFMADGTALEVPLTGAISVNDSEAYIACGLEGYGLMQPALFMVLTQLQSGELVEVLPEYRPPHMPIAAVYPQNRQPSQKVRLFVDWVVSLFEKCPLLQGSDKAFDCYQQEGRAVA